MSWQVFAQVLALVVLVMAVSFVAGMLLVMVRLRYGTRFNEEAAGKREAWLAAEDDNPEEEDELTKRKREKERGFFS
jgi:hypothetical protein